MMVEKFTIWHEVGTIQEGTKTSANRVYIYPFIIIFIEPLRITQLCVELLNLGKSIPLTLEVVSLFFGSFYYAFIYEPLQFLLFPEGYYIYVLGKLLRHEGPNAIFVLGKQIQKISHQNSVLPHVLLKITFLIELIRKHFLQLFIFHCVVSGKKQCYGDFDELLTSFNRLSGKQTRVHQTISEIKQCRLQLLVDFNSIGEQLSNIIVKRMIKLIFLLHLQYKLYQRNINFNRYKIMCSFSSELQRLWPTTSKGNWAVKKGLLYRFIILLMLPLNNNYYAYQGAPQRNNCTFDLKVNVDFSSRRVNLGVPAQSTPFAKTPEIPVVYTDPALLASRNPYLSRPALYSPQNQPIIHQVPPTWQPVPYYARTQPSFSPVYSPQQVEQSRVMVYSDKHNPRSTYDSFPSSSFSMGVERSVEAVECVICDKKVNRQQFHDHLEQHKVKRRNYGRYQGLPASEPDKLNSLSVRNQNSLENAANLYRQGPSGVSQSSQNAGMNVSKTQQNKNSSLSHQIQDTHSRIVYVPRDLIQNQSRSGHYHTQPAYTNSFGENNRIITSQSIQNSKGAHTTNGVQRNNFIQPQKRIYQANPVYQNTEISRVSSMKILNSDLMRRDDSRSLSQQHRIHQNYYHQHPRNLSNSRNSKYQHNSNLSKNNYLNFDSSQLIIQKKKQPSFMEIEQSVIHRINDISRDYSILQLKRQLNISQIEEQSSSDDQFGYYSVRPSPPTQIYQSVSRSKNSIGMASSSNMTGKLTRTKLPVNYLARQEFIVNTMLTRSCYKSSHKQWK